MKALALVGAVGTTVILCAVAGRFAGLLDGWTLREMAAGPSLHHTVIESLLMSVPLLIAGTVAPLIMMRRRARNAHRPIDRRP
jgi:hypothetical protein